MMLEQELRNQEVMSLKDQTELLIRAGYPKELGMSEDEYEDEAAIAVALSDPLKNTIPTLVEQRIDFKRQLDLLGLALDPAVFTFPSTQENNLTVSHLFVISRMYGAEGGMTLPAIAESLKEPLRPANPFETLPVYESVLKKSNVALIGGSFDRLPGLQTGSEEIRRMLVLENFLGKPRISYEFSENKDAYLGLLVAQKHND